MEITDIRVFPVDEEKLKAYVTIVFDRSSFGSRTRNRQRD